MIPLMMLAAAQAAAGGSSSIVGQWINERHTAIVRIANCSSGLCGTIVWSGSAAQRDAARGGTVVLDGMTVMLDFVPQSPGRWRGKLFLPDQNRMVKATIDQPADNVLRVKGCELRGLFCRTQKWVRWTAN